MLLETPYPNGGFPMTSEQATFVLHGMLGGYAFEAPVTRKVIAAVPEANTGYKPDPKSMSAKDLAWHIVASEEWFFKSVTAGAFEMGDDPGIPASIKTIADILDYYDKNVVPLAETMKNLSGDHLAKPVGFFGMPEQPTVTYLGFLLNHSIHHRGQLSVYLRPMGSKVPSIYGGSADEPFKP
jgi:uncharacterized damage-inducible protein DinB